jgi:hypothetical protein
MSAAALPCKAAIALTRAARPRSSRPFPAGVADTITTRRSASERSRCASPADSSALGWAESPEFRSKVVLYFTVADIDAVLLGTNTKGRP